MRITLSIPDVLAKKFQDVVPPRQRSRLVAGLIAKEIRKKERALEAACKAANRDLALARDIDAWQSFEDRPEE